MNTEYVAPMCWEIELVLDSAILAASVSDFADGGDLW